MAKAKKADLNKSQEIRAYAAKHRAAKPKEIAEALTKKHGVEFTNAAVSTTLHNAKKKSGTKGKTTRKRKQASTNSSLDAALTFAKEAGGLDEAQAALNKLRQIKESL